MEKKSLEWHYVVHIEAEVYFADVYFLLSNFVSSLFLQFRLNRRLFEVENQSVEGV